MNIIYIAYSCNPYNGTEDKLGWYIPYYSSKINSKIYIITKEESKHGIETFLSKNNIKNIEVLYVDIPQIYKIIYRGGLYSGRLNIWNKRAKKIVKKICNENSIDIIHQVNPIEFRSIGDFKINNIPFICGPVGGAEVVPDNLKKYIKADMLFETVRSVANKYYKFKYFVNKRFSKCDELMFTNIETRNFLFSLNEREKYRVCTELGCIADSFPNHSVEKKFTILVGGRMIYRKGFDFFLDAIEYIPETYNFSVNVVGTGPLLEKIKTRCRNSKILKDRVNILGKIPHEKMKNYYNCADLFVMPSIRETTGSVVLESIENGVPVLALNRFGVRNIIDETCGFLIDLDDNIEPHIQLANSIMKCIINRKILLSMGNDCHEKAKEFSFQNKAEYFQNIYLDVLHKRGF